jgi:hypothetical protein
VTAEQRRAAGEAEFCGCSFCVDHARHTMRVFSIGERHFAAGPPGYTNDDVWIAALLRALVLQALLDPGTWWQPGDAPPRVSP